MRVTGQTTATERTACTKRVCADFVRYSSRALYYTFRPSAKSNARFASLTGNAEALCIAIGRGDRALVDQIIQSGVSVYGKTFLFEDVLSFAVANCQKGELTALLATSGPAPDNRTRGLQKRLVDVRICTQVEEVKFGLGRVEMAIELLTWYDLNPQASLVQSSKVWLEETCSYNRLSHTHRKQDKLNFIAAVFAHNPAIKIRKAYRDNFLKGYHGYDAELVTAAIPVLIQEKVFEANDFDSTSTGLTAEKPLTLLDVAVNIRDVGTVAAVLALGANSDGIFLGAPSAYRTYSPLNLRSNVAASRWFDCFFNMAQNPWQAMGRIHKCLSRSTFLTVLTLRRLSISDSGSGTSDPYPVVQDVNACRILTASCSDEAISWVENAMRVA